jgi:hypothetical protein
MIPLPNNPAAESATWSTEEVARRTGVARRTVYDWHWLPYVTKRIGIRRVRRYVPAVVRAACAERGIEVQGAGDEPTEVAA